MDDITVYDFVDLLSLLEPDTPLCAELDRWGSPYKNQKAHCVAWFGDQPTKGTGAYSRQKGNKSVRIAYDRLLNPGMMIWMAEALGGDPSDIRRATAYSIEAEKRNYRLRCIAFRRVISFDYVLDLIQKPDCWLYDNRLNDCLIQCKDGGKRIKIGKHRKAKKVLMQEL